VRLIASFIVCAIVQQAGQPLLAQGEAGSLPANGDNLLATFLARQHRHEEVAGQCKITYCGVSRQAGAAQPYLISAGEVSFGSGFEKWIRWDLAPSMLESSLDTRSCTDVVAFLSSSIRPTIIQSDGSRYLGIEPDPRDRRLWRGKLAAKIDYRFRNGPMNAGLMFGEQWLTDFLGRLALINAEQTATGFELTFCTSRAAEGADRITVSTNANLDTTKIVWNKGNAPVISCTVQQHVTVLGEVLIGSASIVHFHSPNSEVVGTYSYDPYRLPPTDSGVLRLPAEVRAVDGAVVATDELTDIDIILGNAAVANGAAAKSREQRSRESIGMEGQWWLLAGIMLAGAALIGYWVWTRSGAKRIDSDEQHAN
jgi:hypothetical protein